VVGKGKDDKQKRQSKRKTFGATVDIV